MPHNPDPSQDSFTAHMYAGDVRSMEDLRAIWQFVRYPEKFKHGAWELVAELPRTRGREVKVYEARMPCQFYLVAVLPDGDKPGIIYRTGSGMGEMAADVARAYHDQGKLPTALGAKIAYESKEQMFVEHPWQENYLGKLG